MRTTVLLVLSILLLGPGLAAAADFYGSVVLDANPDIVAEAVMYRDAPAAPIPLRVFTGAAVVASYPGTETYLVFTNTTDHDTFVRLRFYTDEGMLAWTLEGIMTPHEQERISVGQYLTP